MFEYVHSHLAFENWILKICYQLINFSVGVSPLWECLVESCFIAIFVFLKIAIKHRFTLDTEEKSGFCFFSDGIGVWGSRARKPPLKITYGTINIIIK